MTSKCGDFSVPLTVTTSNFQVKESKLLTFIPLKQVGFGPTSCMLTVFMHDDCFDVLRLPKVRSVSAHLHYWTALHEMFAGEVDRIHNEPRRCGAPSCRSPYCGRSCNEGNSHDEQP